MSHFQLPLDIDSLEIISQSVDHKGTIRFEVKSKAKGTHCHKCGKWCDKVYGLGETLTVQHVSILDKPVYLRICVVRYQCEECEDGLTTSERYDWMERKSKTTKALDAYINRQLIHSTVEDVAKKVRTTAEIVESALHRCIKHQVKWEDYKDLTTIGIDEIALRKGHNNFVVVVSCKNKDGDLSVLAILPDRFKKTIYTFLESIPNHLKASVQTVCTDMYDAFVEAACEVFGKLYRDQLDRIRIAEMKRLKEELSINEYAKLNNMMWTLRKKYECLSKDEKTQLLLLYKHSPKLKEAHTYALKLTNIFNTHQSRKHALTKLERWVKSVKNSKTTYFNGFIKTLTRYRSSILNYFKMRKNSGFVEGLNNKIKVLKRRCYGVHKVTTLFQRLTLDLQGYKRFA
mgnify:CR=1 FL=1